jgi:hypothetical protein
LVSINSQKVSLGQANGPDVDLIVTGTELYATYKTLDGYPAIYDDHLGLFCFAQLVDGQYQSTGVPVTSTPPTNLERHVEESAAVRTRKIAERQSQMQQRSHSSSAEKNKEPQKE